MNRTRRSIVKTAAAAALVTAPLAATVVGKATVKSPSETECQEAVIRHKASGLLTWVYLCPNMEAWNELKRRDPYLATFNTARFSPIIVAIRTTNTPEILRNLAPQDPDHTRWAGEEDMRQNLLGQLNWLLSPGCQRALNR